MIEIDGLTKRFGPILAVDGVSFSVPRGQVLGFLGPNGAGKSTTMKMVTGFLTPDAGTARICGADIVTEAPRAKRHIGYLPEGAPAYPDMTPAGFLNFVAGARGLSGDAKRRAIAGAVTRTAIGHVLHQPIDTLSKGYKRRVGLAQAILHDPDVLILDEPTDGLDPNQKHEVRGMIAEMAATKAIIISTHILEEVHALCHRALIIAQGRVLADGTPAALEARSRWHNAVTLTVHREASHEFADSLKRLDGVAAVETHPHQPADKVQLTAFPAAGRTIAPQIGALLREEGIAVDEMRVETGRLDEVFRTVTKAA